MKCFKYIFISFCVLLLCVEKTYSADGDLDTTFDFDGTQIVDFPGANDFLTAVAIQPDGKIVGIGFLATGVGLDWAITRLNTDGSLDLTFGASGLVTFNLLNSQPLNLAIQSDGKIVITAYKGPGGSRNFIIARFNTDGSFDAGFGVAGIVTTDVGGGSNDACTGITIQPDGKIVVVGEVFTGAGKIGLVRYNTDGILDGTFGTGGIVVTTTSATADFRDVLIQPDGKIVVGGTIGGFVSAVRYNSTGTLDNTFGTGGIVTTPAAGEINSVKLQSNGKIVLAGPQNLAFMLVRLTQTGELDTTFANGGVSIIGFPTIPFSPASKITLQEDDKIIFIGGNQGFEVIRYTADGFLDDTFGVGGIVLTALPAINVGADVAIQADGKIVAGGRSGGSFAFARYLNSMIATNTAEWSDLNVCLNCNVKLQDTRIVFSGESSINGRGNCLILDGSSQIQIAPSSTLLLKNITIKNVAGENIRCLADDSLLKLQNVIFFLPGYYLFETGSFEVDKEFEINGIERSFIYTSSMVSSINPCGTMILNKDVIFRYQPSIADRDLIELVNEDASLIMNGATLSSSTTGLRLTKGNLIVNQNSFIDSDASVKAEGVMFGDGSVTTNNLNVCIGSAGVLEVNNGFLVQADA